MPGEITASLLQAALVRTLEEAAFVFLEPAEEAPEPAEPLLEATLDYVAERPGQLRLATSSSFAAALAANMLGEEEAAAGSGGGPDALGELLNMAAGAIVADVFPDQPCTLGIPRIRRITAAEHRAALAAAGAAVAMVDENGRGVDLAACGAGAAS